MSSIFVFVFFGVIMTIVASTVLSVVVNLILGALGNELYDWLPWIAERILRSAIEKVPAELRARVAEEWAADMATCPTGLSKLFFAQSLRWIGVARLRRQLIGAGHTANVSGVRRGLLSFVSIVGRGLEYGSERFLGLIARYPWASVTVLIGVIVIWTTTRWSSAGAVEWAGTIVLIVLDLIDCVLIVRLSRLRRSLGPGDTTRDWSHLKQVSGKEVAD